MVYTSMSANIYIFFFLSHNKLITGAAKNLSISSGSGSNKSTCCAIKIDSEEIFRTGPADKAEK